MPLDRFGILFWIAVAVLASRVLLEIGRGLEHAGRGLRNILRLLGRLIATGSARPEVLLLVPTAVEPDGALPNGAGEWRPIAPAAAPTAPVLLESMSHDEMDHLLKNWG